ncbi:MAG TPA: tRNA pseudouridine(55) synthase TruB [Phycisphaerales bacterium]|nr:tRNA pseudouridine(55) synthase TruB [Phycisphaerales bacterium]
MHGLLILDKPSRMSSAAAVAIVKRCAGGAKTGHAGTLDPLATGVLVLALGSATKSISKVMASDKRYRTVIDLSAFTTTDDAEGERVEVRRDEETQRRRDEVVMEGHHSVSSSLSLSVSAPSQEAIVTALHHFTGEFLQTPPAYSAVKVGGRRAYAIARAGAEPDIAPRPVIVHALKLIRYDWPHVELDIHCGKGFYVRALARDLGKALGTGGFCASIRRTAVGPYALDMARTIEQLPERLSQDDLLPLCSESHGGAGG